MVCFYDVFVFGVSDIPLGLAILIKRSRMYNKKWTDTFDGIEMLWHQDLK